MRLFTALQLPDSICSDLVNLSHDLAEQIDPLGWPRTNWTREANLHITLKFFGEVGAACVPALCDSLLNISRVGALTLACDHLDFFPDHGPVRIVAVGLSGDAPKVAELFNRIESQTQALGFPREGRKFRAHITLGRNRTPLPPVARKALARKINGASFVVREFVLMESRLEASGATYAVAARVPLE